MESAFGVDHGAISKDLKGFKSAKQAPKAPGWKPGMDSAFGGKSKSSGSKHFMPKTVPTVPTVGGGGVGGGAA